MKRESTRKGKQKMKAMGENRGEIMREKKRPKPSQEHALREIQPISTLISYSSPLLS